MRVLVQNPLFEIQGRSTYVTPIGNKTQYPEQLNPYHCHGNPRQNTLFFMRHQSSCNETQEG